VTALQESEERTPLEHRVLAAVLLAAISLMAFVTIVPVAALPAIAARFAGEGDGRLFAQMVMVAPPIVLMVAAPLLGWLADLIGRKVILLASLALFVVSGAGVLLIDDSVSLVALRLLLGIAGGGLWMSGLALIGEYFGHDERERLLGFASAAIAFVAAGTVVVSGALVERFGWRAPFALYLLGIPILVLAWVFVRAPPGVHKEGIANEKAHAHDLAPMIPYFLVLILFVVGVTTPWAQVGFVLQERGINNAAIQGLIISTSPILGGIVGVAYGYLLRWVSVMQVMALAGIIMGVGILVVAFATSPWVIVLGCGVVGTGGGLFEPACVSRILSCTPLRVHAVAMGLNVCAVSLGQFTHPLLMATLRINFGMTAAFVILATALIGTGACIAIRDQGKRTSARIEPDSAA
jgi:predicted MFS family arabinose efflux permease